MIHATLTPSPLLTLSVSTAKLESFSLRESFELKVGVPRSGPDGLLLLFQRSSHGHGTRMGAGGNKVSMTSAWADFEIVKNAQREGFRVDLMATDRSGTHQRLGYVITVETINPGRAVLRVDGDLSLDMG